MIFRYVGVWTRLLLEWGEVCQEHKNDRNGSRRKGKEIQGRRRTRGPRPAHVDTDGVPSCGSLSSTLQVTSLLPGVGPGGQ